jgi:hypothetical protein
MRILKYYRAIGKTDILFIRCVRALVCSSKNTEPETLYTTNKNIKKNTTHNTCFFSEKFGWGSEMGIRKKTLLGVVRHSVVERMIAVLLYVIRTYTGIIIVHSSRQ